MENLSLYFILLLIGIILGGIKMVSLMNNRPVVRDYPVQVPAYTNSSISHDGGFRSIIISILFVLGLFLFMYAQTRTGTTNPDTSPKIEISKAKY